MRGFSIHAATKEGVIDRLQDKELCYLQIVHFFLVKKTL